MSSEGHLEGLCAWVGAKLGGVNEVGGGELRQIIESQKTIGVWETAVGTAELWCCPWGGGGVEGEREYQGGGPKKKVWAKLPSPPKWSMEKGKRSKLLLLRSAVVVVSCVNLWRAAAW